MPIADAFTTDVPVTLWVECRGGGVFTIAPDVIVTAVGALHE